MLLEFPFLLRRGTVSQRSAVLRMRCSQSETGMVEGIQEGSVHVRRCATAGPIDTVGHSEYAATLTTSSILSRATSALRASLAASSRGDASERM